MPENETLFPDARTASRWQPLKDRLARGESPNQIFPELEKQFYLALRRVFKQWKSRGVDPKALIDAAQSDPATLPDLIKRTRNDGYAKLIQEATAGQPNADRKALIQSFLDSVWEHARSQMQIDRLKNGAPEELLRGVQKMLDRLTSKLLKDPSRVPHRPRRRDPPPDIDDMLSQSLLP
jgi:hypothetical protein